MPDNRYTPRLFFKNDLDFGKPGARLVMKERTDWPPKTTEDQARAALIQHEITQVIRVQVSARFQSRAAFADAIGMKLAQLGRLLRGESILRLEDLGTAIRLLGLELRLIEGPPRG